MGSHNEKHECYQIVRSHIGWKGERNILYKDVETSPWQTHFKKLERKPERDSPKRTISVRGGLGLLQIVSEPDTGRCASEDAGPQRGWTLGDVLARTLSPEGGWIVRSHIEWGGKQVLARTLGPKGGWIVRSHIGWRGERTFFIRV